MCVLPGGEKHSLLRESQLCFFPMIVGRERESARELAEFDLFHHHPFLFFSHFTFISHSKVHENTSVNQKLPHSNSSF